MNPKLSDGGSRTLPPGAAVLRHLLRPHSMSMMAALEKTLASEGKKVSNSFDTWPDLEERWRV